jgi:UDP-N-acetylmuramoylalanine--D-glutamate ligase
VTVAGPVLVYGMGIASEATARALVRRGYEVVVADDVPTDDRRRVVAELGAELVESPDDDAVRRLVRSSSAVAPAPGVPETHAVVAAALEFDIPLRTEIDLAYEWEQDRLGGPRPMIAITGTDGKTTTTMMVAALLGAAGLKAAAVGNTEVPLIAALDTDAQAFAVECSSFRLSWLRSFRAEAAIWLNLAPDHQNWHRSMESYELAKANVWRFQRSTDVAIGWSADPVVRRHLETAKGRRVTFGLAEADYRMQISHERAMLAGPKGPFAEASSLHRTFPHDLSNALAAAAACIETGLVRDDQIDSGLAAFHFPPHRIEPLGEVGGVSWFNDSKATSPHAALTAIRSFESLVLVAGGRNKGLDLSSLATEARRIRAVIAIGESADEIRAAFSGLCPVFDAADMDEVVARAAGVALPGDAVVLSPACASFDWFPAGGYPARGEAFRNAVQRHRADASVPAPGGAAHGAAR